MDRNRLSTITAILGTFVIVVTFAQSPSDYPTNVPGSCASPNSFDCGNGRCIDFNMVRNCVDNCGNNADEQCGAGQMLCDTLVGTGCGKCVSNATAASDCLDRRYSRLCDEGISSQPDLPIYKCVGTPNCVLLKWLNDGADDCGDFSDEDPCLQGFNCSLRTSPTNSQFTLCTCKLPYKSNGTVWARPDPTLAQIPGTCESKPLQFDCGGGTCIDIAKFRDCVPDCPNRSDEACWLGTTLCLDGCTCVPPAAPTAPTCPAATIRTVLTTRPTGAAVTSAPATNATAASSAATNATSTSTSSSTTTTATSTTTRVTNSTITSTSTPTSTSSSSTSTTRSATTSAPTTVTNATVTSTPTTTTNATTTSTSTSSTSTAAGTCAPLQYRCMNGQCISEMFVSDRQQDCSDNTDEAYCGRYLNCSGCAYSFISHSWICGCPNIRDGICYPASLPAECADMTNNGPMASGVYSVMRPNCASLDLNQCIAQVRCDFDTPGGPWIVIQRRGTNGTAENFFRTWQDYKQGFGNREAGDFWQGNDYVSALSNRIGVSYSMLVLLTDTNGRAIRAAFDRFYISSEAQNYTLTLGRVTEGDDDMATSRTRQFGTSDHDVGGCGGRLQTGWWLDQGCAGVGDLNMPMSSIRWPGTNHAATIRSSTMLIRLLPSTNPTTSPATTTLGLTRPPRTPGQSGADRTGGGLFGIGAVFGLLIFLIMAILF